MKKHELKEEIDVFAEEFLRLAQVSILYDCKIQQPTRDHFLQNDRFNFAATHLNLEIIDKISYESFQKNKSNRAQELHRLLKVLRNMQELAEKYFDRQSTIFSPPKDSSRPHEFAWFLLEVWYEFELLFTFLKKEYRLMRKNQTLGFECILRSDNFLEIYYLVATINNDYKIEDSLRKHLCHLTEDEGIFIRATAASATQKDLKSFFKNQKRILFLCATRQVLLSEIAKLVGNNYDDAEKLYDRVRNTKKSPREWLLIEKYALINSMASESLVSIDPKGFC